MKAIVVKEYGSEEVLEVSEIEAPSPSDGEVLVEIKAAGVNPVDTYIRQGNHVSAPPVPFTPGKDGAGIVEAIGSNVKGVAVGDRVYVGGSLTGTYAEYALVKETQIHPLPSNVTFEQGAGVFVPYATAFRALIQKACVRKGSQVLVHGASGAVGIAVTQFAKAKGAKVFGTASTEKGRDAVVKSGADEVFNHREEGYLDRIREQLGGADIIIEMLANVNLVNDFLAIRKGGTIVVVGSRGEINFDPRLTMTNDITIKGMSLFNASEEDMSEILAAIDDGLRIGTLKPLVAKAFSLDESPEAHRYVIEEPSSGKVVIKI